MSASRIIGAIAAVCAACVLPAFLFGAMALQLRRDLRLDPTAIGLGFAIFYAVAALVAAPSGRITDRHDPVPVVRLAALISAAASLIMAAFARSLWIVAACLAVAGAANALCQTAANLVIARALPEARQGFALAVKQSAIPGGALLAGLAVPLFAVTFGWRWAFVAAAALVLVTAAYLPSAARPGARAQRVQQKSVTGPDLPMRVMVLLTLAVGLAGTAASGLGSFMVAASVNAGLREGAAGLLLSVSSIAGIGVRLLAGAHVDRHGGAFRLVIAMLACGAAAFVALALGTQLAYLIGAPLAFCTAWAWPGLFNLAIVRANPSGPAAAIGITQTGQFTGAVIGPVLFGLIAEHASYRTAWLMASGIALVAVAGLAAVRAHVRDVPRHDALIAQRN